MYVCSQPRKLWFYHVHVYLRVGTTHVPLQYDEVTVTTFSVSRWGLVIPGVMAGSLCQKVNRKWKELGLCVVSLIWNGVPPTLQVEVKEI